MVVIHKKTKNGSWIDFAGIYYIIFAENLIINKNCLQKHI